MIRKRFHVTGRRKNLFDRCISKRVHELEKKFPKIKVRSYASGIKVPVSLCLFD